MFNIYVKLDGNNIMLIGSWICFMVYVKIFVFLFS